MLRTSVVCSFVIALGGTARADDSIAGYLAQRIPEELATEGVVLARANLRLEVEQVGDKLLVSLVDLSTGRVAASTRIDQVPADRDAAVASVTHVAAELAAQAMQRPIALPPAPPPNDPARREIDEMRFSREALWFPPESGTTEGPLDSHRWRVFQGEGGDQLDPLDFYRRVGRPDLIDGYLHRRNVMIGYVVASGVAFVAGAAFVIKAATDKGPDCTISMTPDQFSACIQADIAADDHARSTYVPPALILGGVSLIALTVAGWYGFHLQPISEREAKSLADQYNQNMRRNLGLPVVERRRLRDFHIAPFVTGHDGGLVLGARF
jgi:hypothetical protein